MFVTLSRAWLCTVRKANLLSILRIKVSRITSGGNFEIADIPVTGIPNSAYNFQTLGNAISFITGVIAALLYGNIGIKVFYSAVFRDIFHFPALNSRTGKWLWVGLGELRYRSARLHLYININDSSSAYLLGPRLGNCRRNSANQ